MDDEPVDDELELVESELDDPVLDDEAPESVLEEPADELDDELFRPEPRLSVL